MTVPTFCRSVAAASFLACAAITATPAAAQDSIPGAVIISGNATVVSDYRFRGVSASRGDPAIQGGIAATHISGIYAGAWGSSVDLGPTYGEMELDLYAGWAGQVSPGLTFDAGLLYYLYPTGSTGADTDYFEPYAAISTTLGPVTAKLGAAYAWEQDALGGDNLYVYTNVSTGIPTTPLTVSAHVGYDDSALAPPYLAGGLDQTGFDYALGVSAAVRPNLTLGLSYIWEDGVAVRDYTDDSVVASLSFNF